MSTFLGIDYPTWWFLVIGGVFTGYAILDGFDLGAGALHLFFKNELDRRKALNAIGPVWDGNEVWIVIGGGALFAGFPVAYAAVFSAFYIPFMLFLVALIFRGISIEFRSKEKMKWWRRLWDTSYAVSSAVLALALGIVLGNILQGLPMNDQFVYQGSAVDFINPYALLVGITTLALFMMHGAIYLVMKTEEQLYEQLTLLVRNTTIFFVLSYVVTTVYTLLYVPHLSDRFNEVPILFFIPLVAILNIANITRQISRKNYLFAFVSSAVTVSLLLIMVAVELFPVIVINTLSNYSDLTVYAAASSDKSLGIMLTIAAIGVPLVAIYTTFVFWTFKGKVRLDETSY